MYISSLFHVVSLAGLVWARNQTSTYVETNVPTGTPVPGDYRGALRPQVHFSPPKGFMNDPNGLFRDSDGVYHVYYQYNPTATTIGNQHWGHATSRDGYTFINQPIALFPPNSSSFAYSGSIVVDENNTSGFFPDQNNGVVAILTIQNPSTETQALAYSKDGGYTFEWYEGNPVIDASTNSFRDPKVIWHAPTKRWVMAVAFSSEFRVAIYTSPDLKSWTHVSDFARQGILGLQWECPNLVEIPIEGTTNTMWALTISISLLGRANGGSVIQYFPGSFDGTTFRAVDSQTRTLDFAGDSYAGQFFYGIPAGQKPLFLAFAANTLDGLITPTADKEGWRTTMLSFREMSFQKVPITGWTLISRPYNIKSQYSRLISSIPSVDSSGATIDFSSVQSQAIWFEANISAAPGTTLGGLLNLDIVSSRTGEKIQSSSLINGPISLSRAQTFGLINPVYPTNFVGTSTYVAKNIWTISGLVDRTLLELFINDGVQNGNMLFFPTSPVDTLKLSTLGLSKGVSLSLKVWGLKEPWTSKAGSDGIVRGNVTAFASMH